MKAKREPRHTNYVAIAGTNNRPLIYCPACGEEILEEKDKCPHVLFVCEQGQDGEYVFDYVHPELKTAAEALQAEFTRRWQTYEDKGTGGGGEESSTFGSRLHLNLSRTFVLSVTTALEEMGGGSEWETVVGIEWPTESQEPEAAIAENSMNMNMEIKVGQIWGDLHQSRPNRFFEILFIGERDVKCQSLKTGKTTHVRKDRLQFGSRHYFLVLDWETLKEATKQLQISDRRLEARLRAAVQKYSGKGPA